jgi:hypothetical protein
MVLDHGKLRADWAVRNYGSGKYFPYSVLRRQWAARLPSLFGEQLKPAA